jgi:hypothetical protein
MVSRIMINLRDPALQRPADRHETVTTAHGGCVSTLVLDDSLCTTAGGTV